MNIPPGTRPPRPVILLSLAEPPALSFASRRSLRRRACSAARWAAASSGLCVVSVMTWYRCVAVYIKECELSCFEWRWCGAFTQSGVWWELWVGGTDMTTGHDVGQAGLWNLPCTVTIRTDGNGWNDYHNISSHAFMCFKFYHCSISVVFSISFIFKSNSTAHNKHMVASGASIASEKLAIHIQRILGIERAIPAVIRSYPLQQSRV